MLSKFETKIAEYICFLAFFESKGRYVLAISGGADSMALLHTMAALKREGVVCGEFVCGHINHGLRGAESDGDESFVVEQGRELGLEVVTSCVDVRGHAVQRKLSIETAGRMQRIEGLIDIARKKNCGWADRI